MERLASKILTSRRKESRGRGTPTPENFTTFLKIQVFVTALPASKYSSIFGEFGLLKHGNVSKVESFITQNRIKQSFKNSLNNKKTDFLMRISELGSEKLIETQLSNFRKIQLNMKKETCINIFLYENEIFSLLYLIIDLNSFNDILLCLFILDVMSLYNVK